MKKLAAKLSHSKLVNPFSFFAAEVIVAVIVGWLFYSTAEPIITQLKNLIDTRMFQASKVQSQLLLVNHFLTEHPSGTLITLNDLNKRAMLSKTAVFNDIINNQALSKIPAAMQDNYYRNELLNLKMNLLEQFIELEKPTYGVWLTWRSFVMWVFGILFTQLVTDIWRIVIRAYKNLQEEVKKHTQN